MKKRLIILGILICIFLFFSIVALSNDIKYDFRKTNWGMNKEQVKETESLKEKLFPLPIFIATKEYVPDKIYTIQMGVFSKEEEAQNLAKKISDRGYQTYIVEGETFYKVRVGEFKSYEEAQSFSDKLKKIAFPLRNDLVIYEDCIWGFDCEIYYCFLEDKLFQSSYLFDKSILHEDPRIEDYEELKELLIKKYGNPTIDGEEWKDDLSKRNELDRETAINKGHLVYNVGWETSTTKIFMTLYSYKNKTYLQITYSSKELEEWVKQTRELVKQIKEKEALKDF